MLQWADRLVATKRYSSDCKVRAPGRHLVQTSQAADASCIGL